jgi:hypothetical protein
VRTIPVIAHEAGDEQFGTNRIRFGKGEGVMDEQGVTDGLVDYAV